MIEQGLAKESTQWSRQATKRARERANASRWSLETAVFLFAILILILILLFEGVATEIVAPVGFLGLTMVWLVGWRQGKQLYGMFYQEELLRASETTKHVALAQRMP